MATPFENIIDMALDSIQDYKLNNLFKTNPKDFDTITNGFLVKGLPEFGCCKTDLSYDISKKEFSKDLSLLEISILSYLDQHKHFLQ